MGVLSGISSKNFCIIGDVIVDHYRFVSARKLSPEAPVIIFGPEREEFRPGGAANVANNLAAIGAGKVFLCSVVGRDWLDYKTYRGSVMAADMAFCRESVCDKMFVVSGTRRTTIKERIVTSRQQVARIDLQTADPLCPNDEEAIIAKAGPLIMASDAVIFSDYAHGVMTPRVAGVLMAMAISAGKPTIVDSKAKDSMFKYRGCTMAMPNIAEAREITGLSDEYEDGDVAACMLKGMRAGAIAITMGRRGVLLATPGGQRLYPSLALDEVVDVTGAGDTVVAATAAALSLGMAYDETMRLSQAAAGVVVRKLGTATASAAEIESALEEYKEA